MKTVVSFLKEAEFKAQGLRGYFEYRDLNLTAATDGRYVARVIRAIPGKRVDAGWHVHLADFRLLYVLKGWLKFEYGGELGSFTMTAGDAIYQAPEPHAELAHSDDLEVLEVASPASFSTEA